MNERNENKQYYGPRESGKGFGDIFAITVIAAVSGFIIGLLFAPQSGLKTRKVLNEKIKKLIDRGKFAMLEARVMGEEFLEKSMKKVEKVSSKVKSKK